jgi:hypothetical protein
MDGEAGDEQETGKHDSVLHVGTSDWLKGWFPMESAPKDGRLIILLIAGGDNMIDDAEFGRTIGHNDYEMDNEDRWQFAGWCWTHDHYVEGRGKPVGWWPFPQEAL